MTVLLIAHGIVVLLAAIGAVTDWRTGKIPNWLTLPPLVLGPLAWGIVDGLRGAGMSLLGLLACSLVPYLMFRRGAIGGGDVKLFAAIGAIGHLYYGITAQLLSFVAAALFALGRLAWDGKLFRTVSNALFLAFNPVLPKKWRRDVAPELMTSIRIGVAIFAGAALALLDSHPRLWM